MMTEHDWFAAFAMHALASKGLGSPNPNQYERIAKEAQDIASAMTTALGHSRKSDHLSADGHAIVVALEGICVAIGGVGSEIEDSNQRKRRE